jgi:hypothetical protein
MYWGGVLEGAAAVWGALVLRRSSYPERAPSVTAPRQLAHHQIYCGAGAMGAAGVEVAAASCQSEMCGYAGLTPS